MYKYLILLAIFFYSCEKIFHEDDNQYIVLDKYEEKLDLINGIYANLTDIHNEYYLELIVRSDDVNSYNNYFFSEENMSCGGSSSGSSITNFTGNIYKKLYTAIINANSLIKYTNPDEEPELLGEVYFLRAYCYLKLARFFGCPPLIKDIDVKYNISKPTYKEVYEFIVSDLYEALNLLPDTYTGARILNETPHKGTAKAMLAEVYLTMAGFPANDTSKYSLAASYAEDVILNSDYYGISLLDDFNDLWKKSNKHNKENIFGLFFKDVEDGTINRFNRSYVSTSSDYSYFNISSLYIPELKYFDNFPDNYRKICSMLTGDYAIKTYELPDTTLTKLYFKKFDAAKMPCTYHSNAGVLKWVDLSNISSNESHQRTYGSDITLYLLRYAHTLLTYAEAKGHLGELDESAYNAINMIRRRANHVDINKPSAFDISRNLTPEEFTDSVILERSWELFFEPDGRWFDIIRLDLKNKLANYRYSFDSPDKISNNYLSDDWYFYLIPQEDRWFIPELEK